MWDLEKEKVSGQIKSEYFNGLDTVLASFVTDFHKSEDNRKYNIELGAKKVSAIFL